MDIDDKRTQRLPNGLNIEGKLEFGPESSVMIETPFVFVQGVLEVVRPNAGTKVPHQHQVKFLMTKSRGDVVFYPSESGPNKFACGRTKKGRNEVPDGCKMDNMAFVVAGGKLDVSAIDPDCPTWVPLLDYDDRRQRIQVDSAAAECWHSGAELLLTSDSMDPNDHHIVEVRRADTRNGWLTLTKKLEKLKTSVADDPNMAVEVALLSRNFIIEADIRDNEDKGGHLIVMQTPGVRQKLEGVQVSRFGIRGTKGRYPIHFHLNRDIPGSLIRANAVVNSNQRCVVIHGTHNVTIQDNVAYNNFGHCYMTEDGFEYDNKFIGNLGARTKIMPEEFLLDDIETDDQPGTFWFANPMNDVIGNVAAGSEGEGIWWELKTAIRGPSMALAPPGINPLFLPGGRIENNIAHSNIRHGMTVYLNGWFPEEQTLWLNPRAYKNGLTGVFYHATRNMKMVGGYFSDNSDCVRNHFADNIVIEDVTCVGISEHMKKLAREERSNIRCGAKQNLDDYVGGMSFQPNEGENTGTVLKNIDFSGFVNDDCRKSAALWLEAIFPHDKLFDNYQTFEGLTFAEDTNKITACDALDVGVRNIAIEDAEGTFSPTGKPGFFIQDESSITSFFGTSSCTGVGPSCLRFCEGACLRVITFEVNPSKIHDNVIMTISNGKKTEEIPRSSFYWNGVFEDNTNANFFDETKDWTQVWYGVAVPPGHYTVSFLDKTDPEKPILVWPDFVREYYNREPVCASKFRNAEITFEYVKPDYASDGVCNNLIRNGNFEDGVPTGWLQHNTNFTMVSPGADGSAYAMATTKRTEKGASWSWSIGQSIDVTCLKPFGGRFVEISGQARLLDDKGKDVKCDPDKKPEEDGSCAMIHLSRRLWEDGVLIKKRYDDVGTLATSGDGSWTEFSYEITLPTDIDTINQMYLLIDGAPGKNFLLDNLEMKLLPTFIEALEGTRWKLLSGKGTLSPLDEDQMQQNRAGINSLYDESPNKIFHRRCESCAESHMDIYYRRLTRPSRKMNLLRTLESQWTSEYNNCMGKDFALYSTYDDAVADTNRWKYCNFDNAGLGVGFPRNCGPETWTQNQWSYFGGREEKGQSNVAIVIEGEAPPSEAPTPAPKGSMRLAAPTPSGAKLDIPQSLLSGATASIKCTASDDSGAENAIDGKSSTVATSCHTYRPWLRVDLGEEMLISTIKLSFGSNPPSNFEVSVTDSDKSLVWEEATRGTADKEMEFTLGAGSLAAEKGRYIWIMMMTSNKRTSDTLEVVNVEVMGHTSTRVRNLQHHDLIGNRLLKGKKRTNKTSNKKSIRLTDNNVAFASQSCTYLTMDANYAIDGNKSGRLSKGDLAATCCYCEKKNCRKSPQWWQVDLGANNKQYINNVKIIQRTDDPGPLKYRIMGAEIHVIDLDGKGRERIVSKSKISKNSINARSGDVSMNIKKEGRIVRIVLAQNYCMQLAEVEVYGYYTKAPKKLKKLTNLARKGRAKQSRDILVMGAKKFLSANIAINGRNEPGTPQKHSMTNTCEVYPNSPYWQVDLGYVDSYIHLITIYNTGYYGGVKLYDFDIQVLDDDRKVTWEYHNIGRIGAKKDFIVDNYKASRYVKVSIPAVKGERKCLQLTEVEVMGYQEVKESRAPTPTFTNLASRGHAEQSCTYKQYHAGLAIDGSKNSNFDKGSVSSTCCKTGPQWWSVTLPRGSESFIGEIIIYNRRDLQARLSDFTVEVIGSDGKTVWEHLQAAPVDDMLKLEVEYGTIGREVKITMNNQVCLQLAEVEVMGFETMSASPTPTFTNLALNQPTFMECTLGDHVGARATDGNTNGSLDAGSVAHTCVTEDPWIMVDLGSYKTVVDVIIYNRLDKCCKDRLNNFEIQIMDENTDITETIFYDGLVDDLMSFHFDHVRGRFVRIQMTGGRTDFLHIAELEVYGYEGSGDSHDACNVA
jgi:hypothetical protein